MRVTIRFLSQTSDCFHAAHTPMGNGIGMERGVHRPGIIPRRAGNGWAGNTERQLRVDVFGELPNLNGRALPEESIITALLSPTSMSHAQEYRDDEWVETTQALQGPAVFEATGE